MLIVQLSDTHITNENEKVCGTLMGFLLEVVLFSLSVMFIGLWWFLVNDNTQSTYLHLIPLLLSGVTITLWVNMIKNK